MDQFSYQSPVGERNALQAGRDPAKAAAALILLHGRGSNAADIITLAPYLRHPEVAFVAPDADGGIWYPYSFLRPPSSNEPFLSTSLAEVDGIIGALIDVGINSKRILLAGFSQGACLALEYVARHRRDLGGVIAFSGGLIGFESDVLGHQRSLSGLPIFLGCSDIDFYVPRERVLLSARALEDMGASVTTILYPDMGHTINEDELSQARVLISTVVGATESPNESAARHP